MQEKRQIPEDTFIVNERHEPFVAGESAQLGDLQLSWVRRLTILLLALASLGLGVTAAFDLNAPDDPIYNVTAEVLEKRNTGTEFEPEYRLTYRYTDHQGTEHTVEHLVSGDLFFSTSVGREIDVSYEEGQRQRAEPVSSNEEAAALSLSFFGLLALIVVILWVLYFWLYRPSRINRTLERDGRFIVGQITRVWPIRAGRRNYINVQYTFKTPEGESISERETQARDLPERKLPKAGTPILVRYVNPSLYRLM